VSRQSSISRALCVFCPQDAGRRISRRSFVIAATPERIERRKVMLNTIRIHRVFRAAPEKVYRAFFNREAMANWL
jgi:hypothetical protein